MKANILEIKYQNEQSDIYAKKEANIINFYSNQYISKVKNISLSLTYNPSNV